MHIFPQRGFHASVFFYLFQNNILHSTLNVPLSLELDFMNCVKVSVKYTTTLVFCILLGGLS